MWEAKIYALCLQRSSQQIKVKMVVCWGVSVWQKYAKGLFMLDNNHLSLWSCFSSNLFTCFLLLTLSDICQCIQSEWLSPDALNMLMELVCDSFQQRPKVFLTLEKLGVEPKQSQNAEGGQVETKLPPLFIEDLQGLLIFAVRRGVHTAAPR